MRIRVLPASRRISLPWYASCLIGGFTGFYILSVLLIHRAAPDYTVCTLKRVTGIPCAGCRGTRAGMSLLRGDVPGAFFFNPLLATLMIAIPLGLFCRFGLGKTLEMKMNQREKFLALGLVIAAVALNWAYVIYRGG